MKLSARNQIPSRVTSITRGEAIANVVLDANGTRLVASVTIEAVDELGIGQCVGDDDELYEAQAVMHNLRPYIRKDRDVAAKWASISGYWRRGRTEESFRQWKRELAEAEAGAAD